MKRLKSKVVLITGATRSIGKVMAELFYQHGATVIITGKRDSHEGKRVAKNIGCDVKYFQLDVSKEIDWQNVTTYIKQEYTCLDVLINNAGIEHPSESCGTQNPESCSLSDWKSVHRTNVDGVFLGCKYGIQLMKENSNNCSIINIGSRSGLVGVPTSAAYSSSKAAIRNYTKTVALHCAANNYSIRCNIIHPAAILTQMWDKEFGVDMQRESRIHEFSKYIPLKRMGKPLDVAYAALYLASDESAFMTGAELILDGGIMAGSAASAHASLIDLPDA